MNITSVQWGMVITLLVIGIIWWKLVGWGVGKFFDTLFAPWKKKKLPKS